MTETEEALNLKVGSVLQLQPVGAETGVRFGVKVIGYLPEKSLVVTTPQQNGKVQIVRDGQKYAVRLLRGSSVQGFVASVLHSAVKPYPHLHLNYPSEIESIVVRNAQRVQAGLPAVVRNTSQNKEKSERVKAEVGDLSNSGAKIVSHTDFGQVGDVIEIAIWFDVAGEAELVTLVGIIRNRMERTEQESSLEKAPRFAFGVQFNSLSRLQQLLVHAWVMERMHKDSRMA